MDQFKYFVKDHKGEPKSGVIEAINIRQASGLLHERGMVVIKLIPKRRGLNPVEILNSLRPVSLNEMSSFTRQLATMVSSGLSLVDTLNLLERQTENPKLKQAISQVIRDVQSGSSLSNSMSKQSKVFSKTYVSMVRAAESSGSLDLVLNKLAESLEREREFSSKVVGAMIYPSILIGVTILVVILVSTFVLPKLKDLFTSSNVTLPLATVILLGFSDLMSKIWIVFVVGFVVVLIFLRRLHNVGQLRRYYDFVFMNLPYLGDINKNFSLSQATRTLGLLVGSGVPIIDALKTSADVAINTFHKEALSEVATTVEKGIPLNVPLSKNPLFPPVIGQMVAVGEETGKLEEVLVRIADYFEVEAEHRVRNFTTALEPIIVILLAIGVLFILIAVVLPLYKITTQFSNG